MQWTLLAVEKWITVESDEFGGLRAGCGFDGQRILQCATEIIRPLFQGERFSGASLLVHIGGRLRQIPVVEFLHELLAVVAEFVRGFRRSLGRLGRLGGLSR